MHFVLTQKYSRRHTLAPISGVLYNCGTCIERCQGRAQGEKVRAEGPFIHGDDSEDGWMVRYHCIQLQHPNSKLPLILDSERARNIFTIGLLGLDQALRAEKKWMRGCASGFGALVLYH